ncbi:unnamed protein product [Prunus armeniaca]
MAYAERLEHGNKMAFTGHRRFLSRYHPYRKLTEEFNGKEELDPTPMPLTREQVWKEVESINYEWGKRTRKRKDKNVCESIFGTFLNIPGKTKDGVAARKDLVTLGGCITERVHVEESVQFCSEYMADLGTIGVPISQLDLANTIIALSSSVIELVPHDKWEQAHRTILDNTMEVDHYINQLNNNNANIKSNISTMPTSNQTSQQNS